MPTVEEPSRATTGPVAIDATVGRGKTENQLLIDTMQLVEPYGGKPVPDHLLETKLFTTLSQNAVIKAKPTNVHFQGFELNKMHVQRLTILNAATEVVRTHIIPPQTKYFYLRYHKPDRMVPGLTLDCTVEFMPDEWRYYYDCIRINCPGEENLLIPIHAYPVMATKDFPEMFTFPATPVGHSVSKAFPLRSDIPIDFEFQLTYLQQHPFFKVEPMEGIVPANGETKICVTFSPTEFETATMRLELLISQFNMKPAMCTFLGSSVPGLLRDKTQKELIAGALGTEVLDPRCVSPLGRVRAKRQKLRVSTRAPHSAPQPKELEIDGVKFPANLNTPYAVAQVLNQEPGRIRAKDIRETLLRRADSSESTNRQMKEARFEHMVRQAVYEERQNQLRWQIRLGNDPISNKERTRILDKRANGWQDYIYVKRGDPVSDDEYHREQISRTFRRTFRDVHELPTAVAEFGIAEIDEKCTQYDTESSESSEEESSSDEEYSIGDLVDEATPGEDGEASADKLDDELESEGKDDRETPEETEPKLKEEVPQEEGAESFEPVTDIEVDEDEDEDDSEEYERIRIRSLCSSDEDFEEEEVVGKARPKKAQRGNKKDGAGKSKADHVDKGKQPWAKESEDARAEKGKVRPVKEVKIVEDGGVWEHSERPQKEADGKGAGQSVELGTGTKVVIAVNFVETLQEKDKEEAVAKEVVKGQNEGTALEGQASTVSFGIRDTAASVNEEMKEKRGLSELKQSASVLAAFDVHENDKWERRYMALNAFIQAARKVIIRNRAEKKLRSLREAMIDWRKKKCAIDAAGDRLSKVEEEEGSENAGEWSQAPDLLSAGKIAAHKFMQYVPPNQADDLYRSRNIHFGPNLFKTGRPVQNATAADHDNEEAPDALGIVPCAPTEIFIKTRVPFFKLKVPQYFKLNGYRRFNVQETALNYISPKQLKELRTGADDEVISLPKPTMIVDPVMNLETAEYTYDEETHLQLTLVPPEALFKPIDYPALHIFNPAPGLQVFLPPMPYAEIDPDYHLCPLPRYSRKDHLTYRHAATQRRFLNREDVIRGVMSWRKFPSQGLTSLSNTPTLTGVWVPRWEDPFCTQLLPTKVPQLYDGLSEEDRTNVEEDEEGENALVLTPEMVTGHFAMLEQSQLEEQKVSDMFPMGSKMPASNIPVGPLGPVPREKREEELEFFINKRYNRLGAKISNRIQSLNNAANNSTLAK